MPINERIKDVSTVLERHPRAVDEEWFKKYLGTWKEHPGEMMKKYQEKEHHLIKVSGCDMDKLIELFAAGWTLQPPKYERTSLARLAEEAIEKYNDKPLTNILRKEELEIALKYSDND